jgi:hypothetical protein
LFDKDADFVDQVALKDRVGREITVSVVLFPAIETSASDGTLACKEGKRK